MSVSIEVDDAVYAALEVYARTVGAAPEMLAQQLLRKQLFNSETCQSKSFERNLEAFYTMLPELLQQHEDQFVALYNGEIVGFGTDRLTLAKEMYISYERSDVLVKAVSRTLRVRHLPSPPDAKAALMFVYSTAFLPPAPALEVEVRDPQTGATATSLAKIDTGADGTIIPEDLVHTLHLIDFDEMVTVAFNGKLEKQPSYLVDLVLAGRTFTDLEVVAAPLPYLLLGRDVLNQLVTTLNGPQQSLDIQ